jgi:hypothetical protein
MNVMKPFLAAFLLAACAAVTSAQTVAPPPLPLGSQLARPDAGLHLEERKRHVRAHHHKLHHKKDYTRPDDAVTTAQGPVGGLAVGRGQEPGSVRAMPANLAQGRQDAGALRNARWERCDRSDYEERAAHRARK